MPEIASDTQKNKLHIGNLRTQVIDYIARRGPSVPIEIAQGLGRESYFIGAILSELLQSKQVKISHARKGGSRVYYLPGQEEKLSVLYAYLPDAEKKAYDLLKQNNIITARQAQPVERVALENLKDFANQTAINGETAWQWRLYKEEAKPEIKQEATKIIIQEKQMQIMPIAPQIKSDQQKPIIQKQQEDTFIGDIENYFKQKNIQIIQKEVIRKNSESNLVIRIDSQIGPIDMFVCAKNKKKINDQDIMLAHQKGQNKRMPTLFLTTGEQSKKARDYIEKNLKGYMVFRKV